MDLSTCIRVEKWPHEHGENVGKYTIHGSYGNDFDKQLEPHGFPSFPQPLGPRLAVNSLFSRDFLGAE